MTFHGFPTWPLDKNLLQNHPNHGPNNVLKHFSKRVKLSFKYGMTNMTSKLYKKVVNRYILL